MSNNDLAIALSEFRRILSSDQAAQLTSFSSNAPTADDVVRLTDDIIQSNAGRKSRIFASRVQGLLGSVQQYCKIVDTCAGPNQIAALVWGSIKLVLLVSSNFSEYFDKLSERVAQLSNYCPRLSEYEKLFPASLRLQQALSDFYAVVVVFCSKALKVVQEKGTKRFFKSTWKSFKVEFKETEESLSAAKDEVIEELRLASEQAAHGFRCLLTAEIEENRILRGGQVAEMEENKYFRSQQTLALQQTQARQIQKIMKEEERQKIRLLRQIPNYDYTIGLRQAQALRCEGTCRWLLDRPEFRDWIDQTDSKHLWCYGIPGCGKTVLTGYVIDYLKTTFSARDDTVIIYYFFDFSNKKSLHTSTFLRCIVHQTVKLESLLPDAQRRLESLFGDQMDQAEPDARELIKLFIHFYGKFKNAFLVIDGLDEADKSDQRNIKSFLKEVEKVNSARILAINHPDVDMSKVFSRSRTLQIKPEDLKTDIEIFVQTQIKHSQEELSVCSPSLLDKVEQVLVSSAEGMFLWVDLEFKAILDACEDGNLERIPYLLETPPRKITELYHLSLTRLSNEDGELSGLAIKVFQWVLSSRRPLTISEMEEAIAISADQKSWTIPPFKLDQTKLCRMCGNLVKYDNATQSVSLAHHTVLSFLLGCSDIPGVATIAFEENRVEQYLADTCLAYLSFTDFHKAIMRTTDTAYVHALNRPIDLVTSYVPSSAQFLASLPVSSGRFGRANKHVDLVNILRSELMAHQSARISPSFQLLEYCKAYWHSHSRYTELQDVKRLAILENFVHGTHLPVEWKPWSSIPDRNSLPYWKIFVWAIREGHAAIFYIWQNTVKTQEASYWGHFWPEEGGELFASLCATAGLEQLEIILDSRDREENMARPSVDEINRGLVSACQGGHIKVVERLLQEKVDVNAASTVGESGRTALQAAAGGGHLAVVERLLQEKAHVNAAAARGGGRTALQAAAGGGHLAVVERLLQEKADVNAAAAEDGGRTALQAAAEGGYLAVVERLLQEQAGVNAAVAEYSGRTALQAAAEGGHLAVVERLLQEKVDINAAAVNYYGRTALQAAAEGGHLAVIERLLQEKADINATAANYYGRTALQAAAEGGHLAVIERLLQEKADINAAAAYYHGRTALQAAAGGGHLAVVERLLQEKADINAAAAAKYSGRTALQAAAEGGHLAVVERLLQEKAGVNAAAAEGSGRTALQAAAEGGHLAVVERLLQENVDINAAAEEYSGRTALQAAAGGGHLAVVERLLQGKADINAAAAEKDGRAALQAAAGGGHLAVVERLLQEKADVNAATNSGGTALQAAAKGGHIKVIERLRQAGALD